jgi:hypothetical protein
VVCGGAATAAAAAAAPPLLRQRRHRSFVAAPIHRPTTAAAVTAATSDTAAAEAEEDFEDMESYGITNEMGPAARATLRLLEWPALCEHVAMFASTAVGQRAARALEVPATRAESERLIAETRCARFCTCSFVHALVFMVLFAPPQSLPSASLLVNPSPITSVCAQKTNKNAAP